MLAVFLVFRNYDADLAVTQRLVGRLFNYLLVWCRTLEVLYINANLANGRVESKRDQTEFLVGVPSEKSTANCGV